MSVLKYEIIYQLDAVHQVGKLFHFKMQGKTTQSVLKLLHERANLRLKLLRLGVCL